MPSQIQLDDPPESNGVAGREDAAGFLLEKKIRFGITEMRAVHRKRGRLRETP